MDGSLLSSSSCVHQVLFFLPLSSSSCVHQVTLWFQTAHRFLSSLWFSRETDSIHRTFHSWLFLMPVIQWPFKGRNCPFVSPHLPHSFSIAILSHVGWREKEERDERMESDLFFLSSSFVVTLLVTHYPTTLNEEKESTTTINNSL